MLEFFRKRREERQKQMAAYESGQEAGAAMFDAVEAFFDHRQERLFVSYLTAFKQCLGTIHEAAHPPSMVALAEWQIFLDELEQLRARLENEVHQQLQEWLSLAAELGTRELLDQHIASRIDQLVLALRTGGASLLESVTAELKFEPERETD